MSLSHHGLEAIPGEATWDSFSGDSSTHSPSYLPRLPPDGTNSGPESQAQRVSALKGSLRWGLGPVMSDLCLSGGTGFVQLHTTAQRSPFRAEHWKASTSRICPVVNISEAKN